MESTLPIYDYCARDEIFHGPSRVVGAAPGGGTGAGPFSLWRVIDRTGEWGTCFSATRRDDAFFRDGVFLRAAFFPTVSSPPHDPAAFPDKATRSLGGGPSRTFGQGREGGPFFFFTLYRESHSTCTNTANDCISALLKSLTAPGAPSRRRPRRGIVMSAAMTHRRPRREGETIESG